MVSIERQNQNYERALKKQKTYQIGDIVGIKIADVDRSNTAPSILPCKIVRTEKTNDGHTKYTVSTQHGIIASSFLSTDVIDLTETIASELRQLDPSQLPIISVIQACQLFTNYKSTSVCKCLTSCESNRCPCKKRSIKCCSKCHRGKCLSCKNKD